MKNYSDNHGFTIIEVMIVLAIASLILLIIFLAVPTLQANERNYKRKNAVGIIYTKMEQYKADHGGHYPKTAAEACDFLNKYASSDNGKVESTCSGGFSGGAHESVDTANFTISYFNNDVPHDYRGDYDEIDIALSHWCNTDPSKFSEDPSHPITNGNAWPFDQLFSRFAIWTALERSSNGYCLDNYPRGS